MKSLWVPLVSFLAGALVMLFGIWAVVGFSDVEHVPVQIHEARLLDAEAGRVELIVGSCNGAPRATFDLGAEFLEVEVRAFRFKSDRDACLDIAEIFLNRSDLGPLPTELLDVHTGEIVGISNGD